MVELAGQAASVEESEKATERLRIAEAGLSRSVAAQLEGHKQFTTAENFLAYSEARLADTLVVAPLDGLIVKRYRDPGDIGVPGSPILMLVSTQEIWVSAWVDGEATFDFATRKQNTCRTDTPKEGVRVRSLDSKIRWETRGCGYRSRELRED